MTQRLTFLAALLIYLEKETLATREDLGALLGGKVYSRLYGILLSCVFQLKSRRRMGFTSIWRTF